MKKKLLSIMACTSMVLVGGLALTACGGETTKSKSMELQDFLDYIERPEVVTDVVGYTSTGKTVSTSKEGTVTFETKQSVLKDRTGEHGKLVAFSLWNKRTTQTKEGTNTVTTVTEDRTSFNDNMVYYFQSTPNQDPTKPNEVVKTAYSTTMEKLLQATANPEHPENSLEMLGNVTETYVSQIGEIVGEMGEDENGNDIPVLAYGTTLTTETKGSKTTYTFLRKYEDRTEEVKYSYEYNLVFENDAIIELHGNITIDSKYDGKTEATADIVAVSAVEFPNDLNTYTDMTEETVNGTSVIDYGTLANATADLNGQTFTNEGLEFNFVGNRTYTVKGTAQKMTADQAREFGEPATAEAGKESVYAVLSIHWAEDYKITYKAGQTIKTIEFGANGENGDTFDIIYLVTANTTTYSVTVEDADGNAHTYTFDFSALTNFAPAE